MTPESNVLNPKILVHPSHWHPMTAHRSQAWGRELRYLEKGNRHGEHGIAGTKDDL